MRERLAWLLDRSQGFVHVFQERRRQHGWKSACVFAQGVAENRVLRLRSRLTRTPRVECPCCGWKGLDFLAFDCVWFLGRSTVCPQCHAHARHRTLNLYLRRHEPALFREPVRVLHFAPEATFWPLIESNPRLTYFGTDLGPLWLNGCPGSAFRSDITRMAVADGPFDYIFCSHVLEHLKNDASGIAEIHRMLKPGGVAYIMVPLNMGLEESEHYDPPRADMFGHYWWYSAKDFGDKLAAFEYEAIRPEDFLTPEEHDRHRIFDWEIIYRCRKPMA